MPRAELVLVPRDGLFFKDARGWFTGDAGRAAALPWPFPTTLLGALRSCFGRRVEAAEGRALDPAGWIGRTSAVRLGASLPVRRPVGAPWSADHRLWPAPLDMVGEAVGTPPCAPSSSCRWHRFLPAPCPGDVGLNCDRPDEAAADGLWLPVAPFASKPVPRPPWWTEKGLADWMTADRVPAPDSGALGLVSREQVHVSIRPEERTSVDGALFSHSVHESIDTSRAGGAAAVHEWGIAVEATSSDPPAAWRGTPVVLGGDGRVGTTEVAEGIFAPSRALSSVGDVPGLRLLVVTPAEFEGGWLPDGFVRRSDGFYVGSVAGVDGLVLRSAIVDRPVALSGWDVARRRPKPSRRLVPAGSVYFFTREGGGDFSTLEVRQLWLASWGRDVDSGLGRLVPGAWTPPKEAR